MQPLCHHLPLVSTAIDTVKNPFQSTAQCIQLDVGGATYNCMESNIAVTIGLEAFKHATAQAGMAQQEGNQAVVGYFRTMLYHHAQDIKQNMERFNKTLTHLCYAVKDSRRFYVQLVDEYEIPAYQEKNGKAVQS
uniref:FGGY_C domain-containing protein n=1 Tax=Panagrellus redivivus TaxID=6233 RepID=A0A7E4ZXK8_PANRE